AFAPTRAKLSKNRKLRDSCFIVVLRDVGRTVSSPRLPLHACRHGHARTVSSPRLPLRARCHRRGRTVSSLRLPLHACRHGHARTVSSPRLPLRARCHRRGRTDSSPYIRGEIFIRFVV